MPALTVLVANRFEPRHLAHLREHFPRVNFVQLAKDGTVPAGGEDGTVLMFYGMTKADLSRCLAGAPGMRWVHLSTAGFDWGMVPEVQARSILMTRSAEAKKEAVAEFAIGLIFLVNKRFRALLQSQSEQRWLRCEPDLVRGKTLGVIGAGAIGCEIARLGAALGMRVLGTKRTPEPLSFFEQVLPPEGLPTVLQASDYVVVACPLTRETRGMIAAEQLRLLKKTAYLINIARGGIVVEADLLRALHEGWFAGACLDAFDQEPLPADSPLWTAPNTIITPHCAYASPRNVDGVVDEFVANLDRWLRGEPLQHTPKHLELGY